VRNPPRWAKVSKLDMGVRREIHKARAHRLALAPNIFANSCTKEVGKEKHDTINKSEFFKSKNRCNNANF
jgi:hypothetical protein